jgi:hypothetical protein
MSFDSEPEMRYLLCHPESDCIFESFSPQADEILATEPCVEDVTGIKHYEDEFKLRSKR